VTFEKKTCSKCGEVKPLDAFYQGLICKTCNVKRQAAWVKANPEKRREQSARYAKANPEKLKELATQYSKSADGKEKNRVRSSRSYEKNREAKKEASRTRYKENPEKCKASQKLLSEKLADSIVANSLGFRVRDAPKELIQAKREQIQITRLLRELNKELKVTK
jgi:uncharacterized Zn finger protein (UPF0148 family)